MNDTYITRGTAEQAELVADLIIELLHDFNIAGNSRFVIDRQFITDTSSKLLKRDTFGCYIAFEDKNPIGLITISHSFAIYNGGDFGVITELYVRKERRSKGIGRLLLEKAYEFARLHNWKKLEVGAPNKMEWPRTISFYKENGFEEKGPKLRLNLD